MRLIELDDMTLSIFRCGDHLQEKQTTLGFPSTHVLELEI